MDLYGFLLRQVLFRFDAEAIHEFTLTCLSHEKWLELLTRLLLLPPPPILPCRFFGLQFRNPVGLAAGMDKNGIALAAWEKLGFGFIEMGTVTAIAQGGNPRPRLFRFPDVGALVNRMGFNNEGAQEVAHRLEFLYQSDKRPSIPIGINIGKSRATPLESAHQDYLESFRLLYPYGDYFVINISSPNTPGLRNLQSTPLLTKILGTLRDWQGGSGDNSKPLLIKISPDLAPKDIDALVKLCEQEKVAGIVATNTTLDHSALTPDRDEEGGLSGKPLQERSNEMIRHWRKLCALPIIGSGGILTDADAYEKLQAGADLVQIYTGLVYRGPRLIHEICQFFSQKRSPQGRKSRKSAPSLL